MVWQPVGNKKLSSSWIADNRGNQNPRANKKTFLTGVEVDHLGNRNMGEIHMIDFQNAYFVKLRPVNNNSFEAFISPMFVNGESILATFQGIRDGVVFTNKRIFAINVQGIAGKKKDFSSLPYSKIQAFSVETAGVIDLDSELELWFSGLGKVKFEFVSRADVAGICRMISERVL